MALGHWLLKPALSLPVVPQATRQFKKALYFEMLPEALSILDKFTMAKEAGFDGIEVPTTENSEAVAEMREAARSTGLRIHSVMNQRHWQYPLSSHDPEVVKKSIDGVAMSLRNAKDLGADTVLLVPAVVNAQTGYQDAYTRSQKHIRELLPLADELNVIIAVENVWNKFLLSPLEFSRYVDEFDSPRLRAYFDVGNVVISGAPQDWIRILGKRIVKVHIKDFNEETKQFVDLGEGSIDWLAVRQAFQQVGYRGYLTAELDAGDLNYLRDVSERFDKIIAGEKFGNKPKVGGSAG